MTETDIKPTEDILAEEAPQTAKHYFVDEAGDGTLFDRKGHVIAGTEGCSSHFALGVLDVADPAGWSSDWPNSACGFLMIRISLAYRQ